MKKKIVVLPALLIAVASFCGCSTLKRACFLVEKMSGYGHLQADGESYEGMTEWEEKQEEEESDEDAVDDEEDYDRGVYDGSKEPTLLSLQAELILDDLDECLDYNYERTLEKETRTQVDIDSDTIQWFNACYAAMTRENKEDITLIGGVDAGDEKEREAKQEELKETWGIMDRESAIDTIYYLIYYGYHGKYESHLAVMTEKGLRDIDAEEFENALGSFINRKDDSEMYNRYKAVYSAYHVMGDRGIDAWDYCNAMLLYGEGYAAGYFTTDEAMNSSLVLAKAMQFEFANWDDMIESYFWGYNYWMGDDVSGKYSDTEVHWDIYKELLTENNSPYSLPWDLKLEDTWSDK